MLTRQRTSPQCTCGVSRLLFFPGLPVSKSEPAQADQDYANPGPGSLQEVYSWTSYYLDRLLEDRRTRTRILQAAQRGVFFATDYSGSGCAEQSALMIRHALQKSVPGLADFWHMVRACDVDPACQFVLREHLEGPERPCCVFGDLLDRLPETDLAALRAIQSKWRSTWEFRSKTAKDNPDNKLLQTAVDKACTEGMFQELMVYLDKVDFPAHSRASCSIHDRQCFVHGPPLPAPDDNIRLVQAGNSCIDWSSMGKLDGWLGDGLLPFLVWAYETRAQRPDWIIQECTVRFDSSMMDRIFKELYWVQTIELSPMDLGLPTSRPRKWTVSILKSKWTYEVGLQSQEIKRFFRKLELYGDIFFQAPHSSVSAYYQQLAAKRGRATPLPSSELDSDLDWEQVLPGSLAVRLKGYQALARSSERWQASPTAIVNLRQDPSTFASIMEDVPTLLRQTSSLFLMRSNARSLRPLLPDEALAVMGWPIWGPGPCAISPVLNKLSDRQKNSLAGNGMNITVSGVLQLWCLAFAVPVSQLKDQQPAS